MRRTVIRTAHHRILWFVLLLCVLLYVDDAAADSSGTPINYHFGNMYTDPWFFDVMAASAIGWFMGLVKGYNGTRDWLARYGYAEPP
jgi:hypothetical protein